MGYIILNERREFHGRVSWSHVGGTHTQSHAGFRPYYVEKIWQPFSDDDDGDASREIPAVRRVRVATDKSSRIIGVYPSVHHPFCVYALRLDLTHTHKHTRTQSRFDGCFLIARQTRLVLYPFLYMYKWYDTTVCYDNSIVIITFICGLNKMNRDCYIVVVGSVTSGAQM